MVEIERDPEEPGTGKPKSRTRIWLERLFFAFALLLLLITLVNASWMAPAATGAPRLIAHRGVAQQFDHKNIDRYKTCTAARIDPPVHEYLENSLPSMEAARRLGADMIEVDIAPTADGKIAVFHDWTLECRTDGKGETRQRTMAELKALDIGYGYTSDGGKTFPFRGRFQGGMPTLEEALAELPATPILFNFKSNDPAEADQLATALKASKRNVEKIGDAFYGAPGPSERIRQYFPKAWAWSLEAAKKCTKDYFLTGWSSMVPESCRNRTMVVPLNYQWLAWGWPNRLLDRMQKVGAHVVVSGPYREGSENIGIDLPEQIGKIPAGFNGFIWVEDIWSIGPARRPQRDFRTEAQTKANDVAMQRRRDRD